MSQNEHIIGLASTASDLDHTSLSYSLVVFPLRGSLIGDAISVAPNLIEFDKKLPSGESQVYMDFTWTLNLFKIPSVHDMGL